MLRNVVKFVFQQKPQMVDEHDRPLHIISDGNRHSTRLFPLDVCVYVSWIRMFVGIMSMF